MFYKVIYNDKVVDVLDNLIYLKYQEKHDRMVLCREDGAQAIMSSNGEHVWHVDGWYKIPVSGYDTVHLEQIDKYEYERLKALNCGTVEDIVDRFVLCLIKGDTSLLSDSLHRLYSHQKIDESAVIKLCEEHKIVDDEKSRILKCSF